MKIGRWRIKEAKDVVEAGQMSLTEEKNKQELETRRVVAQEIEKQLDKRLCIPSRHSSFAGSYILRGMKAINKDNDMVVNK
ncbi:unnamed protein product [Gongylonema pulchrum]|uniref:Ovule protein n=1 Tax=Gongylonema pulchrum TaxID=637853 RepID=A0A183DI34_9BILA|nr:unnamed protein product [Gongylonema pulchrum]